MIYVKDSKLIITKVVQRKFDENGEVIGELVEDVVADGKVSLGSINKPNKDIKHFRYDIPTKKKQFGVLGELLGIWMEQDLTKMEV